MQLILKENVIGLGYKDDVVTVKDGYGRNYLIPTGKAVIASKSALKCLEEELKQRAHKLAKIKADAEALAESLKNIEPIVVATKVSSTGVIYGSVNSLHIAEALKERGFDIDRKTIVVKDVKAVGDFVAVVKLHKEVSAEVPFTVVAENAPEEKKEEAPVAEVPAVEAPVATEEVSLAVEEEEAPAVVEEEAPAEAEAPVAEADAEEAPAAEEAAEDAPAEA
ncbi:MAG: 50S ribosomal protein L9 [Alloprevotella sp.]|nr:50S ribosomal protein L9 [Alloprevotella sp.]